LESSKGYPPGNPDEDTRVKATFEFTGQFFTVENKEIKSMSNELIQLNTPFQFSDENQQEFDVLIQRYPSKEAAMLPTLHMAQRQAGYITPEVMVYVAKLLEVSVMKVKDVVTFYPMFFEEPVGKYVLRICHTLPCALRDCKVLVDHIKQKFDIDTAAETDLARGTTADGKFTLLKVECLASCDVAPVMMVNDDLYKNLTPEKVDEILDSLK
jgi:NADH-quinone oxidoreductase E subunit